VKKECRNCENFICRVYSPNDEKLAGKCFVFNKDSSVKWVDADFWCENWHYVGDDETGA